MNKVDYSLVLRCSDPADLFRHIGFNDNWQSIFIQMINVFKWYIEDEEPSNAEIRKFIKSIAKLESKIGKIGVMKKWSSLTNKCSTFNHFDCYADMVRIMLSDEFSYVQNRGYIPYAELDEGGNEFYYTIIINRDCSK